MGVKIASKEALKIYCCAIGVVLVICAFGVFWELRHEIMKQTSVISAIRCYLLSFFGRTLKFAVWDKMSSLMSIIFGLLEGFAFTSPQKIARRMEWTSTAFHMVLASTLFLAIFNRSFFPVCWAVTLEIFAPGSGQTLTLIFERQFRRISPFSYIMTAIFGVIVYAVIFGQIVAFE